MPMLVQFGQVFGIGMLVQLGQGMLVVVPQLLARGMGMQMRVLVRMRVFMGMRMDCSFVMPVLVGMAMGVDMRMSVLVFGFGRHGIGLRFGGSKSDFSNEAILYVVPTPGKRILPAGNV